MKRTLSSNAILNSNNIEFDSNSKNRFKRETHIKLQKTYGACPTWAEFMFMLPIAEFKLVIPAPGGGGW
jgi:hypothetical protein